MTIERRTFIQRAALVAATPALANLLSLSSIAQSQASLGSLPPQPAVDEMSLNCPLFKIDG
jgi:hypothetical protein